MNNLFSKLKSREMGQGSGERTPMANLMVQVEKVVDGALHGIRLDTGEPTVVRMRALSEEDAAKLKEERTEFSTMMVEKGYYERKLSVCDNAEERANVLQGIKSKVEPGGIVQVDACYEDAKAGGLNCRWANVVSRWEGHNQVMCGAIARINKTYARAKENGGTDYDVTLTVADVASAIKVNGGKELHAALAKAFDENGHVGAGVMVRAAAGDQVVVMEQRRGSVKVEGKVDADNRPVYVPRTPEDSADYFMNGENGQVFSQWDGTDGMVVEVIPTIAMRLGSKTVSGMLAKATKWKDEAGVEHTRSGEDRVLAFGKRHELKDGSRGFAPCNITFIPPSDDYTGNSVTFLRCVPTSTRPQMVSAAGIHTANIAIDIKDEAKQSASAGHDDHDDAGGDEFDSPAPQQRRSTAPSM